MDHWQEFEELPAVARGDCPGESVFLLACPAVEQLDGDRLHGPKRFDGGVSRLWFGDRIDLRLAARAEHARRRLRHRSRGPYRTMRRQRSRGYDLRRATRRRH